MGGSNGTEKLENYLKLNFEVFQSIPSLKINGIGKLFDDMCLDGLLG